MKITKAEYVSSFVREDACPKGDRPEFAFIGRSNVGKSSLINMITDRKELAKVSKQPGKTQCINYFDINDSWYLVDLPGYGYAKISKKMRAKWKKMIDYYLENRDNLQCAFVLLDSRHELQEIDKEFVGWCGEHGVPIVLVYTKSDKIKSRLVNSNIAKIEKSLLEDWDTLPQSIITSAETGIGKKEILTFIEEILNSYD